MPTPHRVRPLNNRVLIRPHAPPAERQTDAGLILPTDPEPQAAVSGDVVAVGEWTGDLAEVSLDALPEVGDVVLFASYGGTPIVTPDRETLRLMDLRDVLAIVAPQEDASFDPEEVLAVADEIAAFRNREPVEPEPEPVVLDREALGLPPLAPATIDLVQTLVDRHGLVDAVVQVIELGLEPDGRAAFVRALAENPPPGWPASPEVDRVAEFRAALDEALNLPPEEGATVPNREDVIAVLAEVWGATHTAEVALRDTTVEQVHHWAEQYLTGRFLAQDGLEGVETLNDCLWGSDGDTFAPVVPGLILGGLDKGQALRCAAWLSVMADPLGLDFARVRAAVLRT